MRVKPHRGEHSYGSGMPSRRLEQLLPALVERLELKTTFRTLVLLLRPPRLDAELLEPLRREPLELLEGGGE
jgi:hypothetical protein